MKKENQIQREYTNGQVNKAGKVLKEPEGFSKEEKDHANKILSNWRAIHSYPINTFQATLRDKLKNLRIKNGLVAQRLKRAPSIIEKLKRFPDMNLSRMQDIGGLRAVVRTLKDVGKLRDNYKNSRFHHELIGEKDYIQDPKDSGYRGIHLIYKYNKVGQNEHNGLRLEIQIRTQLQHIWATSVEIMEIYLKQALKSSNGDKKWLDYFSLISSALAKIEGTPVLDQHKNMSKKEIFIEAKKQTNDLQVINVLKKFTLATKNIEHNYKYGRRGNIHLIALSMERNDPKLEILNFPEKYLSDAIEQYSKYEQDFSQKNNGSQVVLIERSSIKNLKQAYPNYFLNAKKFISLLKNKILV